MTTINDFGNFEFELSLEVPGSFGGVARMEFAQDEEKALQAYNELVALYQKGLLPGLDNLTLHKYYQPPNGGDLEPVDGGKTFVASEQVAPPPPPVVREKAGLKGELDLTTLEHYFFYFYYAINFLGEAEALHHVNSATPEEIFGFHLAVTMWRRDQNEPSMRDEFFKLLKEHGL